MKENNVENNKLIAEYMNQPFEEFNGSIALSEANEGVFYYDPIVYLDYDKDWSLLMPVIEKIEAKGATIVEIWLSLGKGCRITKGSFKKPIKTVANTESNSLKEAIYQAVIEYITWSKTN
jgi:hypothetical protein